jgi:hypothetical protein
MPCEHATRSSRATAVSKASGAIDLYAVGQDGRVYLASWTQPWLRPAR